MVTSRRYLITENLIKNIKNSENICKKTCRHNYLGPSLMIIITLLIGNGTVKKARLFRNL